MLTQEGVRPPQPDMREVEGRCPTSCTLAVLGGQCHSRPYHLTARFRATTHCEAADRECPNVHALASEGSTDAREVGR
jgi:hypothetical protein